MFTWPSPSYSRSCLKSVKMAYKRGYKLIRVFWMKTGIGTNCLMSWPNYVANLFLCNILFLPLFFSFLFFFPKLLTMAQVLDVWRCNLIPWDNKCQSQGHSTKFKVKLLFFLQNSQKSHWKGAGDVNMQILCITQGQA